MTKSSWLFLGLFLIGAGLRFHALDRQSLWDDEMSTIHTLATPVPQLYQRFATYEIHPPLYFLQLSLWRALHCRSLVRLRANSAAWGTLSLVLAFFVGRRYGGTALGLLTMAFLALSPYHLAYSQEMRPYAMATAIGLAALLALESRWWFLLGFLWTTQLYTHYWGAFVVAAQVLYGLWAAPSAVVRKNVFVAALTSGAIFALWLPILPAQLGVAGRLIFWVSRFSIATLAKVFLAYAGLYFNMASSVFYMPGQVWFSVLIALLFGAAMVVGLRRGPRAATVWLTVGLLVPWLLSYWKASIFVWYRYPIHMLPAFTLLVAAGCLGPASDGRRRTWDIARRTALIGMLLGSQAWGDWIYFSGWQKANPKAVMQYVHHLKTPDTLVVRPAYFTDLYNFYDLGTTPALDEHLLDSPEKRAALKGHQVIFIAFDVPSDPIGDALLAEMTPTSARYFPGTAHLGIKVYELK